MSDMHTRRPLREKCEHHSASLDLIDVDTGHPTELNERESQGRATEVGNI